MIDSYCLTENPAFWSKIRNSYLPALFAGLDRYDRLDRFERREGYVRLVRQVR